MENKFGFKDFVLLVLMVILIGTVWLAMLQMDRQHDTLRKISSNLSELSSQQGQVRNLVYDLADQVEQGVAVAPGGGEGGSSGGRPRISGTGAGPEPAGEDSFGRLREAREDPEFAEGDWIIDAFGTKVPKLNAMTSTDTYARRVHGFVLESLVTQDPDTLEWRPHIARSWHVEDHSEEYEAYEEEIVARLTAEAEDDPSVYQEQLDALLEEVDEAPEEGSEAEERLRERAMENWIDQQIREDEDRPTAITVTFNLRRGVVFSDGTPLTAEDVVYTWELLNDPELDAPGRRAFYDAVETFEAVDDRTVRFGIREPHYLAFSMTGTFPIIPKHFFEDFTVQEINENPGMLMGSGPYRLETPDGWRPGDLIRLVRNENYWGPRPAFDRLIWKEITADVTRLTEYRNEEIDLFAATNPEQYEQLLDDEEVMERSHALNYDTVPSGYNYIAWNQRRRGEDTRFADKRVRQAMTYLTNREEIKEDVFHGYASVAHGPFDANSDQAAPDIEPRDYNREKALELLAEAGWERDDEGVLRDENGNAFRFTLTYPQGSDVYNSIVLALRDSWARAGISVDLDRTEWSVFRDRLNNRTFDAIMLGWGGGAIEGDIRQMFHSSQIAGSADNFMSYSNPELDDLIDRARSTINEDERMELWQACHRILYEDQPYTFMFRSQTLRFIDDRVHNIQRITTGVNERDEWFVPSPEQKWTQ